MNHQGTATIQTDRLILRKLTLDDAGAAFRNWTNDPKVTEFLAWLPHGNIEVTKSVFSGWIAKYMEPDFYQWAIVVKDINEPIGTITVNTIDEKTDTVQIGYCIGSPWWHMGYTSEAFCAVIAFLFEKVGVQRIEARHDPENPNSGKVMLKCGLSYEGTLRKASKSNRGIMDSCVYSILVSEYLKQKPSDK